MMSLVQGMSLYGEDDLSERELVPKTCDMKAYSKNPKPAVQPIIFDFCYSFLNRPIPDRNELIACPRLLEPIHTSRLPNRLPQIPIPSPSDA